MKRMKPYLAIAAAMAMIVMVPGKSTGQEKEKTCKHRHGSSGFKMSGIKVKQIGDDTVAIYIQKKEGKDFPGCTNWSTVPFYGKKEKFNGHWAGIDFGWNGYVTKNFDMAFPPPEQYLDLKTARSLMVNINPFELNVNIAGNKFGFTSGIGFTMNNYYFTGSYTWTGDSATLRAYNTIDDKGNPVDMKVNKLFISYLTLPLLFEFQTNPCHHTNSFHVTAGVIGGIRLQAYQKQRLYQWNDTYYLVDPKGKKVASFYASKELIRNHDQYHLHPFRLDATVRIGWSFLNLFGTYSFTTLFQKNKGPELYPWTIGITLLGW